jgi:hypothetical protein
VLQWRLRLLSDWQKWCKRKHADERCINYSVLLRGTNFGSYQLQAAATVMAGSHGFWTHPLKDQFHQYVRSLKSLTDTPSEPQDYRQSDRPLSDDRVLSFQDELQFADSVSFIAHYEEGVDRVSTITLKEYRDHLVVLLASNETPSAHIVDGLKGLMKKVNEFPKKRTCFKREGSHTN